MTTQVISETLIRVDATGTCKMLTLASCWGKPNHETRVLVGFSRSVLAFIQASMSTRHAVRRATATYLSVPGRSADVNLRIISMRLQVETMTGDNEDQLSCVALMHVRCSSKSPSLEARTSLRTISTISAYDRNEDSLPFSDSQFSESPCKWQV